MLNRKPYIEFTLIDDFVQQQRPFANEFVLLSPVKDRYAHVERSLKYVQSNLLVPFWFDRGDERRLGAFLLTTEGELDVRRLFSFGSVDQFASFDGNGD